MTRVCGEIRWQQRVALQCISICSIGFERLRDASSPEAAGSLNVHVGRVPVGEHEVYHKRMNDSSGSLAEVGTQHACQHSPPFTTHHYLN